MTFTSHFFILGTHWRHLVVGAAVALCMGLLVAIPRSPRYGVVSDVSALEASSVAVMDVRALREHGAVFRPLVMPVAVDHAVLWADYRLAGTFSLYDGEEMHEASLRRAVVGYRPTQRQYIVSEGDMIEGAEVVRIGAQELVLRAGEHEETLLLGGRQGVAADVEADAAPLIHGVEGTIETRFGRQTGDSAWSLERSALLEYYEELLDEPERLLQVFDSMQPLYAADGKITGYQLQTVGEAEFFEAVGFQEGDKVRAVNTLPMTNRRRAEFFIRQVVENDLSAIVIDMERDGNTERLIYELR